MWKIRSHGYVPSERERVTKSLSNSNVSTAGLSHARISFVANLEFCCCFFILTSASAMRSSVSFE